MIVQQQQYDQRSPQEPHVLSLGQMQWRLDAQVQACPAHPHEKKLSPPFWLDPQIVRWREDPNHEGLTRDPKKRARLIAYQQGYLSGFPDHEGRTWCWQCFHRRNLYDLGKDAEWCQIPRWSFILTEEKMWPPSWYPAIEEEGCKGKEVWLAVASREHYIVVDMIYRYFTTGEGQALVLAL